jgi:hypothetical protein
MGYEPIGKVMFVKQLAEIGRLLQLVRSGSMLSERASPKREFFGKQVLAASGLTGATQRIGLGSRAGKL